MTKRDEELLTLRFKIEHNYILHEYKVYSFGEMFGQIGGLYSVMILMGTIFTMSLFSKLYQWKYLERLYFEQDFKHYNEMFKPKESVKKPTNGMSALISGIAKAGLDKAVKDTAEK